LLARARGKAGVRSDHAPAGVFSFLTHLQGLFFSMDFSAIIEEVIDGYLEKSSQLYSATAMWDRSIAPATNARMRDA
jgi:hypothetical protein